MAANLRQALSASFLADFYSRPHLAGRKPNFLQGLRTIFTSGQFIALLQGDIFYCIQIGIFKADEGFVSILRKSAFRFTHFYLPVRTGHSRRFILKIQV